eukprot:CAMPEP_0206172306 /NCGR_PEP_ID=MMETSP1474-20131121/45250_1 /ASSEMBLY_ACC=CAM_ASM_001110 /TAXON_ID=97495 /ORGANISM="Imantonia sp., Strain RCC918" /LENGTH=193 /DNA_ID=CAMNT_0053580377 /DNA_START=46 /DNA_END=627 /DNA_ORIENTATION=-
MRSAILSRIDEKPRGASLELVVIGVDVETGRGRQGRGPRRWGAGESESAWDWRHRGGGCRRRRGAGAVGSSLPVHRGEAADGEHVLLRHGRAPTAPEAVLASGGHCHGADRRGVGVAHPLGVVHQLCDRDLSARHSGRVRPRKRLVGALKHGGEVGLHALHPRGMTEERRLSLLRLVTQHLGVRTQSPLLEEG